MKGFHIMRNVRVALVGALMVAGVVGCRNRVAEERDALWQESRERQAAMDRQNAELEALRRAAATPAPPPPSPVTVTPQPAPPAPPPPVVQQPQAPEPKPVDVGSDVEVSRNPAAGTVTLNLSSDIFFDAGAATIKPGARASLNKVAAALKADYAGKAVRVEGHTDSDPIKRSKWKSNQELSEARAKAVHDYLVKQGVDASMLETVGHGADMPRGPDKAKNRRVEVVVLVDANAPEARPGRAPAAPVEDDGQNK
jgi:flagellar motor protein MotB